jgi:hypothetical protein
MTLFMPIYNFTMCFCNIIGILLIRISTHIVYYDIEGSLDSRQKKTLGGFLRTPVNERFSDGVSSVGGKSSSSGKGKGAGKKSGSADNNDNVGDTNANANTAAPVATVQESAGTQESAGAQESSTVQQTAEQELNNASQKPGAILNRIPPGTQIVQLLDIVDPLGGPLVVAEALKPIENQKDLTDGVEIWQAMLSHFRQLDELAGRRRIEGKVIVDEETGEVI